MQRSHIHFKANPPQAARTPQDFSSYVLMKKKIKRQLQELEAKSTDNLDLIAQTEASLFRLKIEFMKTMQKNIQLFEPLLFDFLGRLDQHKLTKEFHNLSLDFHPDKFSPEICLREGVDPTFPNVFYQKIVGVKTRLDNNSKPPTSNEFPHFRTHEEKSDYREKPAARTRYEDGEPICHKEATARKLYETSIDYQNAGKGKTEFKHLKVEEIIELSREKLIELRKQKAMEAYENYRIACCKADRAQNIRKRIVLRKAMAISLYLADDMYHAMLYTLGTIRLVRTDSISVLDELQTLLNKIAEKNASLGLTQKNIVISSHTQTCIAKTLETPSFEKIRWLERSIENDLMSFFPVDNLILDENECKNSLIPTKIHTEEKTTNASFLGGLFSLFSSAGQQTTVSDLHINNQLKQIIGDALPLFYRGKYSEFLLTIFHEKSCFDLDNPKKMVDLMLEHGYQLDGIARLIILISNAIFSLEKSIFEDKIMSDLWYCAKRMLYQIDALESRAIEIDLSNKNLDMQEKLYLPKIIATTRSLMCDSILNDPLKEEQIVLSHFKELVHVQEKLPLTYRQWHSSVIDSMRHIVMTCGLPLPTVDEILSENIARNKPVNEYR